MELPPILVPWRWLDLHLGLSKLNLIAYPDRRSDNVCTSFEILIEGRERCSKNNHVAPDVHSPGLQAISGDQQGGFKGTGQAHLIPFFL